MNKRVMGIAASLLLGCSLAGCALWRADAGGVVWPPGDPERGRAAFVALRCYYCHRVEGAELPSPLAQPPVPVTLGDRTRPAPSRERLVRGIIAPSHEFAPGYKEELIRDGKLSRMGDYSDVLTVRQVSDLVAFLESLHPPAAR